MSQTEPTLDLVPLLDQLGVVDALAEAVSRQMGMDLATARAETVRMMATSAPVRARIEETALAALKAMNEMNEQARFAAALAAL
jgi:hypothetical protein